MLGNWSSERNLLFRRDEDRNRFIERLEKASSDFEVRVYLYCLISNHFYLLVETPHGNLFQFMQSINTAYTVCFIDATNDMGISWRFMSADFDPGHEFSEVVAPPCEPPRWQEHQNF